MTRAGPKKNTPTSVRDRLMQLSRRRNEDFNFVLSRYGMERLLYRLGQSAHANAFVLKGAALFTLWSGHPHRATRDIDLLGVGTPDLDRLVRAFRDICEVAVENDALAFDATSVAATRIKEDADYEGVRVTLQAKLGTAVLPLQIDVAFGDAVTPAPTTADFPVLLDSPRPRLRVYPRETVVAEKLEAAVHLGIVNSRMKDFFDLYFLARSFSFDGAVLTDAIAATFERRRTVVPAADPVAFTDDFVNDAQKVAQWRAFARRSGVADSSLTLRAVIDEVRVFLRAPLEAVRTGATFTKTWANGSWT